MKKFENPNFEVETIVVEDVITTSGTGSENISPEIPGNED